MKPTIPEASRRDISPPDSYRGHFGLRTKNRPERFRDCILPHPELPKSSSDLSQGEVKKETLSAEQAGSTPSPPAGRAGIEESFRLKTISKEKTVSLS